MEFRFALVTAFAAFLATAQAASSETLKAVTAHLPPYTMDKSPEEPGFGYELVSEMAKRAGYKLEIEFMPWSRAQEVAKTTPGTMLFSITRSPDREPNYSWLVQIFSPSLSIATSGKKIDSFEQAKSLSSVSVVPNTPQELQLKAAGVTKIEPLETAELAAKMLNAGRIEGWYTHDVRAAYVWKKLGFDPAKLVVGKSIETVPFYVAAHKDFSPETKAKLQTALDAMKADGTYDRIAVKYFGTIGRSGGQS